MRYLSTFIRILSFKKVTTKLSAFKDKGLNNGIKLVVARPIYGDRHNVEYRTRHKLESHNVENSSLVVTTSNFKKGDSGHNLEKILLFHIPMILYI